MLMKMKKQFAELLYNIGFVNSLDPRNKVANIHSGIITKNGSKKIIILL